MTQSDSLASASETVSAQGAAATNSQTLGSLWTRIRWASRITWLRRLLVCTLVAWFILAGMVLGAYAVNAVPTSYIFRPLIVAALLALPVAALATLSGRWAPAVAGALVAAIAVVEIGHFLIWHLVISIVVTNIAERRGRHWRLPWLYSQAAIIYSVVFFMAGAVGTVRIVDQPAAVNADPHGQGSSLYLLLVDGYPRADTLSDDLGIDNGPFLTQLTSKGFDVYEDSHSAREYTELTLLSLLDGSEAGVALNADTAEGKRSVRRLLDEARLPRIAMEAGYEYIVVDSPVGHVTFNTGIHIRHGVITNFEERLLAQSVLGTVLPQIAPYALTSSLREHVDESLASVVKLTERDAGRLVLGHIMAPHLPFLYAADGSPVPDPPYWPERHITTNVIEDMGVSFDYYRAMFPGHLRVINEKLLQTVDGMLARDPDAVIVFFSDHGARYSFERREEWSRSFLAARTPGNPHLFGDSPTTTNILCDLFVAYLELPCQ